MIEPTSDASSARADDRAYDIASPLDEAERVLHLDRARALSKELVRVRADLERTHKELAVTTTQRERTRAELERLRNRRAVDLALRMSRAITAVRRRLTRGAAPPDSPSGAGRRPTEEDVLAAPGPAELRTRLLARIDAAPGSAPIRIGLAGASDAARSAIEGLGWRAASDDPDAFVSFDPEVDVRAQPAGVILVAWVERGAEDRWLEQPWFDDFDIVLTTSAASADSITAGSGHRPIVVEPGGIDGPAVAPAIAEAVRGWVAAPRIDLAIGTPDRATADHWGDYHLALALRRALQARGHVTSVRYRSDWNRMVARRADVVIHLLGYKQRWIHPDQINVLWIISHPALVSDEYVGRQDLVFVASDRFAEHLRTRTTTPVRVLHQATDPTRFHPMPGGPHHEVLIVAGRRPAERRVIVDELTPTSRDVAVYGYGWTPDELDPRHHTGEYIPNARLARYYSAADIVVNDHWSDMAEWGFMTNRLYDAAASGAFVLSDFVREIEAEFDGGIATFTTGAELRALVEHYLAHPEIRAELAERARAAVVARHTFDQRADTLLREIEPLLARR